MYTEELSQSIRTLEGTRQKRMEQTIDPLTPEEKTELLHSFHPDYKKGTKRKIRVGPNKDAEVSMEFANVLEAYSLIDPEGFDLSKVDYDVDVLVVGGGGAGCAAALLAQENGANVLLATKLRLGDANTMMAQGGIQSADRPNDSPATHYIDVVGGGGFHNKPELVRALVMDGPKVIDWLEALGTMFDKEEDGSMVEIHGGGTSVKRMHSARDYSGGEIMKTLRDEVLNRQIDVVEFAPAIELLTDGDRCTGALLYNLETHEFVTVRAKRTILATGGSGRLHIQGFPTTNHYGATGDGVVIAYRAGCKFVFLDTIQYHPTGAAYPEQIVGLLVTEKCRGLGAQLVNSEGNRFVYELETRDAVASAVIRECTERRLGVKTPSGMEGVWLDTPLIDIKNSPGTVRSALPAMFRQYSRFDIDMSKTPILIYPTQHYQNGGIDINERSETAMENLYVAGEASGGVHGRNRLMGNSLLDVVAFGRRAGKSASRGVKEVSSGNLTLDHLKSFHRELKEAGIDSKKRSPMILPDYRRDELKSKAAGIF